VTGRPHPGVGTRDEVVRTRGAKTLVIDLKGLTLVPGFVDAHGHRMMGGLQALPANLLAPPNGVLEENASSAALLKLLGSLGPEGFKTFTREGAKLWASFGYTTVRVTDDQVMSAASSASVMGCRSHCLRIEAC